MRVPGCFRALGRTLAGRYLISFTRSKMKRLSVPSLAGRCLPMKGDYMSPKSRKPTDDGELPAGLSPKEEAEWWDAHKDYWDAPDVVHEVVDGFSAQPTKAVNMRLPEDMIAA